ncbi:MAG: hypothetical protein ACQES9_09685 [Myxococcota bacterium]
MNINRILSKYLLSLLLIFSLPVFSGCGKEAKTTDENSTEPNTKSAIQNKNSDKIDLESDFLLDNSCKADSDCTTHPKIYKNDKGSCCKECGHQAINKKALAAHHKVCKKLSDKGCPEKECKAPPGVACDQGKCKLKK